MLVSVYPLAEPVSVYVTDCPAPPPAVPHVTSDGLLPTFGQKFNQPKLPSVSTETTPAKYKLKLPPPTLLGDCPAIRLPGATLQVVAKFVTTLPSPVCAA